jgi:hypothetical protein
LHIKSAAYKPESVRESALYLERRPLCNSEMLITECRGSL